MRGGSGVVIAAALAVAGALAAEAPAARRVEILSPVYTVEKRYPSMQGPSDTQPVSLLDTGSPELLWVTGFEATMEDEAGSPVSQEFMCHSNLDMDGERHRLRLGLPQRVHPNRVFTISQGQHAIHFPPGFGLPVVSTEPLDLTTQVLNLNHEAADLPAPLRMRHRVAIDFMRDADLVAPLVPLYQAQIYVVVSLDGVESWVGTFQPTPEQQAASCLPGEPVMAKGGRKHLMKDSQGQRFTSHWVVKPGRAEYRTLVTEPLGLEFDTTIHYIAVHVHPFARSLELRDLTTGDTLFRSEARNFADKIGLDRVDFFSSEEGVPVYRDHDYELVAVYENTSAEDQDSMAVMYVYLRDQAFDREHVQLAGPR